MKTDLERFEALKNAKEHLNEEGFIVIDTTPFLYTSKSTDWIDAKNSLVINWLPESVEIDGYQWKKSVEGNKDTLHWRYKDSEQTHFEFKFTTYRYDIEKSISHLNQLDLHYEQLLTEWGVNGLNN